MRSIDIDEIDKDYCFYISKQLDLPLLDFMNDHGAFNELKAEIDRRGLNSLYEESIASTFPYESKRGLGEVMHPGKKVMAIVNMLRDMQEDK